MATIDFSALNNAIKVTYGGVMKLYFKSPTIEPSPDNSSLTIIFENSQPSHPTRYGNILLSDLRINGSGSAPADMATALSSLSTVFPKTNSSSGGPGIEVKADDTTAFAAIQNGQSKDFEVNGVVSRYIKSSTGAKQIVTYPTYP